MDRDLIAALDVCDLAQNPWFWLGYAQEVANDLNELTGELLALAEHSDVQLASPGMRDRYIALTVDAGNAAARLRTEMSHIEVRSQELALELASAGPHSSPN